MSKFSAITYISRNERNREQVEIERDATVWELLQRIFTKRSFKVDTETTEVYERVGGWQWLKKESQEAVYIEMFNDLNAYVEYIQQVHVLVS